MRHIGPVLDREQAFEEFPVALERDSQVLGRDLFASTPLLLEVRAGAGKGRRELIDDIGDQTVGLCTQSRGWAPR